MVKNTLFRETCRLNLIFSIYCFLSIFLKYHIKTLASIFNDLQTKSKKIFFLNFWIIKDFILTSCTPSQPIVLSLKKCFKTFQFLKNLVN